MIHPELNIGHMVHVLGMMTEYQVKAKSQGVRDMAVESLAKTRRLHIEKPGFTTKTKRSLK